MKQEINSESDMIAFGQKIGGLLVGGECIELIGDVGAGKTTITKGIARGIGLTDTIQSPTFTINRTYDQAGGLRLSHYDFYRLQDAGIMADELHDAVQDVQAVTVIEWADAVADVLPADRLRLSFASPAEASRIIQLSSGGRLSQQIIKGLKI